MLRRRSGASLASALAVVALVAVLAGCGDSGPEPPQQVTDRTIERSVELRVTGSREASFDGDAQLRVVVRPGKRERITEAVATVLFEEPLDVGGGTRLTGQIGVVGMYDGDGTYELPAGVGQAPTTGPTTSAPGGTTGMSVAQVTFAGADADAPAEQFGYVLEPCEVEFEEDATEGSAECPALVSPDGDRVSLRLTWGA